MSDPSNGKKQRRKGVKKSGVEFTIKTDKNILHISAPPGSEMDVHSLKDNPNLIKFGQIGGIFKVYALKNNKEVVFIRMGKEFHCFNRFKLKELESLVKKGGWYVGAWGKRTKKYD